MDKLMFLTEGLLPGARYVQIKVIVNFFRQLRIINGQITYFNYPSVRLFLKETMTDTELKKEAQEGRKSLPESLTLKLWAVAGCRCQLCHNEVFRNRLTLEAVKTGQVAH